MTMPHMLLLLPRLQTARTIVKLIFPHVLTLLCLNTLKNMLSDKDEYYSSGG